ncbi:MAG: protein-disulfide reductase DsbD domain-containing protein, partial [Planctomycetota bacterium]
MGPPYASADSLTGMTPPMIHHIDPSPPRRWRLPSWTAAALTLLAALLFSSSSAAAQTASAKLYAKVEGENLLVAIKVTPGFGCYFYDDGPGEVGGQPTRITLGGVEGATWTPVWFPEPKTKYDESIDWTSKVFDKKTVLYAAALGVGADADPQAVTAVVDGQVCDASQCVPWNVDLSFRSEGTEDLWTDFPAALMVSASAGEAAAGQSDAAESDEAEGAATAWEPDFGSEKAKARAFARVLEDDAVELVIQVATPEHWHMYGGPKPEDKGPGIATPTTIEVEGGNVDWEDVKFPRPFRYTQEKGKADGWVWAYEGTFYFGVRGEAYDEFDPEDLIIKINGQSCDEGSCVPVNLDVSVEGEGEAAMYGAAFADWTLPQVGESDAIDVGGGSSAGEGEEAATAPAEFGQKTEGDGTLAFILLAIGAGLFTLLMPCTYPMIPITISYFTKQAEARGGKVLPLALAYGAGIVAIFVLLGLALGPVMTDIALNPITNLVIGIVFVVFALALFGMIDLTPPQALMRFAGNASSKGGYLGVFLMGLTLVITSFTCTGPFVGS